MMIILVNERAHKCSEVPVNSTGVSYFSPDHHALTGVVYSGLILQKKKTTNRDWLTALWNQSDGLGAGGTAQAQSLPALPVQP